MIEDFGLQQTVVTVHKTDDALNSRWIYWRLARTGAARESWRFTV